MGLALSKMLAPQLCRLSGCRACGSPRRARGGSRQPEPDLIHGPPQTDAEGALTAHVGRGTWRYRADGHEEHVCMRASKRKDRGRKSLPFSLSQQGNGRDWAWNKIDAYERSPINSGTQGD
jgi:hypothetical protein